MIADEGHGNKVPKALKHGVWVDGKQPPRFVLHYLYLPKSELSHLFSKVMTIIMQLVQKVIITSEPRTDWDLYLVKIFIVLSLRLF